MLASRSNCTGCTACVNVCAHKAIKMFYDKNGFIYPFIDEDKCVKCGRCDKICHVNLTHANTFETSEYMAAWNTDSSKRAEGSSGGVFGTIAELVLSRDGVVFGAAFDDEYRHLRCVSSDEIDLAKLKKSKYVESDMADSIFKIEKELKKDRWVLFCGTPCEVMGLRAYFKHNYPKLIMIDFLCHGVPSQVSYKKYIHDIEVKYRDKVASIGFRSKKLGWKTYCMHIVFKSGKELVVPGIVDPYYRMYFRNFSYRISCYHCNRITCSEADITLGDFWGVTKKKTFIDDDKGISLVIIRNQVGKRIVKDISYQLEINQLNKDDVKYVVEERMINPPKAIDYHYFNYFSNSVLPKLSFVNYLKAQALKFELVRKIVYKK